MLTEKRLFRLFAVLIAVGSLTLITAAAKNVSGLNAITVSLLYLLVVLATSALAGIACGISIAVVSGLLVNYYFLPPFRTFYIEAPADWVSFGVYIVTALVVSQFAAAVRRRALEADHLEAQLLRLSHFTNALIAIRKEDMTLKFIAEELRRAFELRYCAIYLFGDTNNTSSVSSGIRPSQLSQKAGNPSTLPNTLLDVITEEGPDVQCLNLTEQGQTIGALVISQESLSHQVAEEAAAVVSLMRPRNL